jgi:hypothetical protein
MCYFQRLWKIRLCKQFSNVFLILKWWRPRLSQLSLIMLNSLKENAKMIWIRENFCRPSLNNLLVRQSYSWIQKIQLNSLLAFSKKSANSFKEILIVKFFLVNYQMPKETRQWNNLEQVNLQPLFAQIWVQEALMYQR